MSAAGKRACVIGAGLGGLALAIRLQAAGIATTLVEARERPGGLAGGLERDGFAFDSGPATLTGIEALQDLWSLTGHDLSADLDLCEVAPICRFNWPDGSQFDLSADRQALRAEVARIAPGDAEGFDGLLAHAAALRELTGRRGALPRELPAMLRAAPALVRLQGLRSAHSLVSRYVASERLRQALTTRLLLTGGNPMTTSALGLSGLARDVAGGAWYPRGGMAALADAMARHFERLGGTLRLHDPVRRVHLMGDRASEVACASGWRERFDAVAGNADAVHTWRDLLGESARGQDMARSLSRRRFSPGVLAVHFGLEGAWPGIPHSMVLFGPRYEALMHDIFETGVLPRDFAIFLSHPSVTDPDRAPAGKSTFSAWIPVAHRGKLPIDWEQAGPLIEQRVLAEIGRRLIPDIEDRIVTRMHLAPRDFSLEFNAHLGSAFGLEPAMMPHGMARLAGRDAKVRNFYLVGAGVQPGAGVPGVISGARTTARLMLEDMTR